MSGRYCSLVVLSDRFLLTLRHLVSPNFVKFLETVYLFSVFFLCSLFSPVFFSSLSPIPLPFLSSSSLEKNAMTSERPGRSSSHMAHLVARGALEDLGPAPQEANFLLRSTYTTGQYVSWEPGWRFKHTDTGHS